MKTVVVLSGGMDSATLLAAMVKEYGSDNVEAVSVYYGQRHKKELDCAEALAADYDVRFVKVNMGSLAAVMGNNSQTNPNVDVPEGHYEEESMKQTVVPNRNMLLIGIATSHAISIGAESVTYGAHAGDHAVYPDCRPEFIDAMAGAMALCDYDPIRLVAPFAEMSKGDIVKLGLQLGVPYEDTWTCYNGRAEHCGKCGACQERLEAFAFAGVTDPVRYE